MRGRGSRTPYGQNTVTVPVALSCDLTHIQVLYGKYQIPIFAPDDISVVNNERAEPPAARFWL